MKGGQSAARQHRRAMKKAGVAVAVRTVVEGGNLYTAVSTALGRLEREGADMSSRIAITIGDDHPNFPGRTVVEAKAAASVESKVDSKSVLPPHTWNTCPSYDCPIVDHHMPLAASVERPTSAQVVSRLLAATDNDRDDAGS